MLTKEQEDRIKNLYIIYYDDIKPLTYYVERNYHKFPKSLLKEYRDIYDHIARCYESSADEKQIEENITKAEHHFERIRLDIYKYACDYKRREFSKWKRKYNKYDLQRIDNGDFWKDILNLEEQGEDNFFKGREVEGKDINTACEYLTVSFNIYGDIMKEIKKKRSRIIETKMLYRKVSFGNQLLGFILGIIASVIASVIWNYISVFI